jgi:hypothetical protein
MIVEHFGGTVECENINKFNAVLNKRYGAGVNEFWLSGEAKFPCIAILINGEFAHVTFFPEDGHPGFHSINTENPKLDETKVFYVNTVNEEIEINGDLNAGIISTGKAMEIANEFFMTLSMPKCAEWFEL